jgi:outer membrane protein assembly factor BamB
MRVASCRWFGMVVAMVLLAGVLPGQDRGIDDFAKLDSQRDWPWWRGPSRNGYSTSSAAPTTFSPTENVVWKTPVPGRGHSSPVVVGDKVFLTTADERQKIHSVVAFDRATGKQLWKTDVSKGGFPAKNHPNNTEASPTIASDGERLFATFYHHDQVGVFAIDFNGKEVWKKSAGRFYPQRYEYGYAPSPLLYKTSVILAAEYDGDSFLVAFNAKDGKELWRTPRPNNITFSSPVIANIAGKDQMLLSGGQKIVSFDPATGKQLWEAPGTSTATCGTLVWEGDTVFASGGYPQSETVAIKADGSGKVLWKNNQKCYEQSMLAHKGYLYALTDGILFCWRTSDGKEMWKQRLPGPVSASPVLVGDLIYWANELGTMHVFRANPEKFDPVAENKIENESFASPAIVGGQIFLRVASGDGPQRKETLYCFGTKAK